MKELYKKYGIIVKRSTLHKRLVVDLNYQYIPIVSTYTPTFTQNDEDTLLRRYNFSYLDINLQKNCKGQNYKIFMCAELVCLQSVTEVIVLGC